MEKKVLLFGFGDFAGIALAAGLKKQLRQKGILAEMIDKKRYLIPLGLLTSQAGNERYTWDALEGIPGMPSMQIYEGEGLPNRILLFAGLDSGELEEALAVCRACGIKKDDLKAVLTPHNATWNVLALSRELREEHEALNGGEK